MGDAVNVDLFVLVNITHRHLFLSLWLWLAAVGVKKKYVASFVSGLYIPVHADATFNVTLIMSQVHDEAVYCPSITFTLPFIVRSIYPARTIHGIIHISSLPIECPSNVCLNNAAKS